MTDEEINFFSADPKNGLFGLFLTFNNFYYGFIGLGIGAGLIYYICYLKAKEYQGKFITEFTLNFVPFISQAIACITDIQNFPSTFTTIGGACIILGNSCLALDNESIDLLGIVDRDQNRIPLISPDKKEDLSPSKDIPFRPKLLKISGVFPSFFDEKVIHAILYGSALCLSMNLIKAGVYFADVIFIRATSSIIMQLVLISIFKINAFNASESFSLSLLSSSICAAIYAAGFYAFIFYISLDFAYSWDTIAGIIIGIYEFLLFNPRKSKFLFISSSFFALLGFFLIAGNEKVQSNAYLFVLFSLFSGLEQSFKKDVLNKVNPLLFSITANIILAVISPFFVFAHKSAETYQLSVISTIVLIGIIDSICSIILYKILSRGDNCLYQINERKYCLIPLVFLLQDHSGLEYGPLFFLISFCIGLIE